MKPKRSWRKVVLLCATGGVLFQVTSCAALLTDVVAQQVFAAVVTAIVQALLSGVGGTTP